MLYVDIQLFMICFNVIELADVICCVVKDP